MRAPFFLGLGGLALSLAACSSSTSNGGAGGADAGAGGPTCANAALGADAGDCTTCLQSGCFSQLAGYRGSTSATCAAASDALTSCATTTCEPACGASIGLTPLDGGVSFSATCAAYVSCCVAANSAALLDAGITLASIELSCDQNASLATDAQCAAATAEFLDAGVVCP